MHMHPVCKCKFYINRLSILDALIGVVSLRCLFTYAECMCIVYSIAQLSGSGIYHVIRDQSYTIITNMEHNVVGEL